MMERCKFGNWILDIGYWKLDIAPFQSITHNQNNFL